MAASRDVRPRVTVAAIVKRDGAFLLVEEKTRDGLRFNQPAGHVEFGESLPAALARETLEESGYAVVPIALIGIYRWQMPRTATTYVRFAFAADVLGHDPSRSLDAGIVRAVWLSEAEIRASKPLHRSPMVLRCIDDFAAGKRYPLELVQDVL